MDSIVSHDLTAWRAFFSTATQAASEALSLWTNGAVVMSLGKLQETTLPEIADALQLSSASSTVVQIGVAGELGGQLILTFDDQNGRALLQSLLSNHDPDQTSWSALEISAFAETGNIIGSVYLNHLSELTGHRLWPTPPYVTRDYAIGIVEQALAYQAMASDRVLVFETRFECQGREVEWKLVLVPSPELLEHIDRSLRIPKGAAVLEENLATSTT